MLGTMADRRAGTLALSRIGRVSLRRAAVTAVLLACSVPFGAIRPASAESLRQPDGPVLAQSGEVDLDLAEDWIRRSLRRTESGDDKAALANDLGALAVLHRRRGDLQRAAGLHKQALSLFRAADDARGIAIETGHLAIALEMLGDGKAAIELARESLSTYESLEHDDGIRTMTNMLGRLHLAEGQPIQAEHYLRRAIELTADEAPADVRADQTEGLGLSLARQARPEAVDHLTRALEMNRTLGRTDRVVRIQESLGTYYLRAARPDRAEALYSEALVHHRAAGNTEDVTRIGRNLATLYAERGDLEAAEARYAAALDALGSDASDPAARDIVAQLGPLNERLAAKAATSGDPAAAAQRLQRALTHYTSLQRAGDSARIYMKLGELRRLRGDAGPAEADYRTALALFRSSDDDAGAAGALVALAIGQLDGGQLAPAADTLQAAATAQKRIGDDIGLMRSHETLAGIYRDLERDDEALLHYTATLDLARSLNERASAATSLAHIGLIHARQGRMEPACEHWTEAMAMFGSLNAAAQSGEVAGWMERAKCTQ